MKVLQMNCVYGNGSTGKIVYAIHRYLQKQGIDSYVIYGMGDKVAENNVFRTTNNFVRKLQSLQSRVTGYPYGGAQLGTRNALWYIEKVRPDIVHIHCINGYMVNIYRILEYLKEHKIPTVITNHAEFMYTGGCTHVVDCKKWLTGCGDCKKICKEHPISYFFDRTAKEWKLMQQAYSGFEKLYICNVSDWVRNHARKSPFFRAYPVETVFNGLNTETFSFKYDPKLAQQYKPNDQRLVIHVTPAFFSPIKGGNHVIEMAKRMPEVKFLIVGSTKNDTDIPDNIIFVGRVDDQAVLAKFYSIADVCLLTSLRETFSMVTAESLCCGTPVVGFKAGGPESIALPDYSSFVEQGDDDALERELRNMLEFHYDKKTISLTAHSTYNDIKMCKEYLRIYKYIHNQMLEKNKK